MEKVWDELKRIEAQAQQIQTDAQDRAKKMIQQSKADAEKLVVDSKKYAEEESTKRYEQAVAEANADRETKLAANQQDSEKLKTQAAKRMEKAVNAVVDMVLEEQ